TYGFSGNRLYSAFLAAQLLRPLRTGCQLVDERGDRRGERVVRRHHKEAHMADYVGRGGQRAVLVTGAAELGEQIVAALLAGQRDPPHEIVDHEGASLHA